MFVKKVFKLITEAVNVSKLISKSCHVYRSVHYLNIYCNVDSFVKKYNKSDSYCNIVVFLHKKNEYKRFQS